MDEKLSREIGKVRGIESDERKQTRPAVEMVQRMELRTEWKKEFRAKQAGESALKMGVAVAGNTNNFLSSVAHKNPPTTNCLAGVRGLLERKSSWLRKIELDTEFQYRYCIGCAVKVNPISGKSSKSFNIN